MQWHIPCNHEQRPLALMIPSMTPSHHHTLCVVGADDALQTQVDSLLATEAHRFLGHWQLADRASADLLLVDTDSVYGHMDWLREKSAGRLLAACTSQIDAHRDELVVPKPLQAETFAAALNRAGTRLATIAVPARAEEPHATEAAAPSAPLTQPQAQQQAQAQPHTLLDLLDRDSGAAIRLSAGGLPSVYLDPATSTWRAGGSLKGLSGWATHELSDDNIERDATHVAADGEAHPYARLRWLCHLVRGAGHLDAGLDASAAFKLARWPQSERDFPKHFRIATVMLKQASTLEEIAAQSGAAVGDVADFINAYHAIGYVEIEGVSSANESASRGLFGRIKKS